MKHVEPRAILRESGALIFVPDPVRLAAVDTDGGGPWSSSAQKDVELLLSPEDYRKLGQQMPGPIQDFLKWIVSLDDPDPESQGFQDRRTATMTAIISRAREALGTEGES